MYCATLLFPNKVGARFDFDYYLNQQLPLVRQWWGDDVRVHRGISTSDGSSVPYLCQVHIRIESIEGFLEKMARSGPRLGDELSRYTNIEPILQFEEIIG